MKRFFSKLIISVIIGSTVLGGMSYAVTDVPYYHWADQSIKKMISKGFISGYPDGTFKPDNTVTREEASKMISNYIGGDYTRENVFKDVDSNSWSANAINHLASKGFINGYGNNEFKPKGNLTRAEFANIIHKYLDSEGKLIETSNVSLPDIDSNWAKEAIQKVANLGYLKGYSDGFFKPNNNITRAEVAAVLAQIGGFSKNYYPAGDYIVGKDIPAGEYLLISTVNPDYNIGYTHFDISKNDDDFIGEVFYKTSIVTVSDGQTLSLTNCKALDMSLVTDELTPPDIEDLGTGAYRVGVDISPGRYYFFSSFEDSILIAKDSTHSTDSEIAGFYYGGWINLKKGDYVFANDKGSLFSKMD